MYHSVARHDPILTIALHRPRPMGVGDKSTLQVDIHSASVYLSMDLTEAAALHAKLGAILEHAKTVADTVPGTKLTLTFER